MLLLNKLIIDSEVNYKMEFGKWSSPYGQFKGPEDFFTFYGLCINVYDNRKRIFKFQWENLTPKEKEDWVPLNWDQSWKLLRYQMSDVLGWEYADNIHPSFS